MASTYSSNLKIELIGTGEQAGTWGVTTNDNFSNVFEQAIVGRVAVNYATDANKTISATDTVGSQDFRNLYLNLTSSGSLTATRELVVPTINKTYIVQNNTTGGQSITVKTSAGTGITVPNGSTATLYVDGTNVIQAFDYLPTLTVPTLNVTTLDLTNIEVTNIKAKDGTASASIANSTGTFTVSAPFIASGTAALNGGTTIGDASGDSFTINSSAVSIPNGLNFDSNTLFIDSTNNRIAINAASAAVTLAVTGVDAMLIPKGATGDRPTGVAGYLRFNTTTNEFEGYNGSAWASVGGAALSNDTSTSSNLYPLFAAATSGTASTLYTSNAKYLYKPSTGDLQAQQFIAENGIVVNKQTVATSYTIGSGYSASSAGPVTVAGGVTVTVASGSRWVVL